MKNKVPKLRFPEFSGEWEEKKLGEICKITSGGTPSRSKAEYWNGNIPWITTSLIKNKAIFSAEEYITEEALKNSSTKLIKKNSILIAMYGQGKTRGQVAKLGIDSTINQACAAIIPSLNLLSDFIFQNLLGRYDEIRNLSNLGGQENLSGELIKKIKIYFSPLPEQEKIASFLSEVDIKIEKLEKKKELLSQYKKGLMQKLFSQKLRFKDENGNDYPEWIKSKLGKLLIEFSIKSTKENEFSLLSSTTKGMELRSGRVDSSSNTGYKILKRNQIVFSPQNLWLGNINLNKEFEIGIVSPSYKTFDLNSSYIIHDYAAYLIKTPKLMYEYGLVSETGASVVRRNLNRELFDEIVVSIPSLPEQEKIANFLSSIDRKIELVEQELEKNKEFKKGLLQQMFV